MSGVYCPASFAVIGARLVMGDHQDPVWLLWRLPARIGLCGTFAVMGVVITQIYLNRRLRAQHATPVLGGGMYLVATLFPIIVGFTCTKETPRPGGCSHSRSSALAVAAASVWSGRCGWRDPDTRGRSTGRYWIDIQGARPTDWAW